MGGVHRHRLSRALFQRCVAPRRTFGTLRTLSALSRFKVGFEKSFRQVVSRWFALLECYNEKSNSTK